jgi:DNA-binding LytR/AlgR family response regulator
MNRAKHPALAGRRILVVEDEYLVAADVAERLEEEGAIVVGPARSCVDALALVDRVSVDAAVLDINLGAEPAYPIAEALRAARVPFVFASGYDEVAIATEYVDVPRCQKPIDHEALAKLLAVQIEAAQKTKFRESVE